MRTPRHTNTKQQKILKVLCLNIYVLMQVIFHIGFLSMAAGWRIIAESKIDGSVPFW
jgi:hypothetical protein